MKNNILWILGALAIVAIVTQIAVIVNQQIRMDIYKTKEELLKIRIDTLEKDVKSLLLSVPAEKPNPNTKPPPQGKTFQNGHWHGEYWHDTSQPTSKEVNNEK